MPAPWGLRDRHDAVLDLVERWRGEGARWVGLDGLGASGKTTLAELVAQRLDDVAVVHLDDFTRPGTVGWERERFRSQVFEPLSAGRAARYQRWHWTSDAPTDWCDVPPGSTVIVEGIGAAEPPDGLAWDRLIWLSCPTSVRMGRAERRDPGRFSCWSQTWRPIEQQWFDSDEPWRNADLVWCTA